MVIKSFDKRIDCIEKINNICARYDTSVFIYGATYTSEKLVQYLYDNGLSASIKYTVDNEYITEEQKDKGIIEFSYYLNNYKETAPLVFGFYDYRVIMKKREQFQDVIPFMYDFHITVVNGVRVEWNYDYLADNNTAFDETYQMLSSNKSKETMQAYINAAISGEFHDLFVNYYDEVPYFNEKLNMMNIDKLFDCGAYDGDSAHDFINVFKNYDHIFEFEPDESNICKIQNRVEKEKIRDLSIVNKGVWSQTTTLKFASEGKSSSSVSNEGDVTIEVIRLDDVYDDFTQNSLIKMDIEGSELEALKGAERVIREISPALAICVYHKREDLIDIPRYINSLVEPGTYNYYIGFQGLDLAELVFYAIPQIM